MTTYAISARERMLEALRTVLEGIPGVRYVSRQAITREMVPDSKLPAILIDESLTRYDWANRPARSMDHECVLALEVQVRSLRGRGHSVQESTVRELLTHEVLATLIENPLLTCQLDDEVEPTAHARDTAERFSVRYASGEGNEGRALIALTVRFDATFDRRPRSGWQQLLLEVAPDGAEDVPASTTIELTTEP